MNEKKYLKWYNKVGYGSGDPSPRETQESKLLLPGASAISDFFSLILKDEEAERNENSE